MRPNEAPASVPQGAKYNYLFKVLFLGEAAVGKTAIILRFTGDTFDESTASTISVDMKVKFLDVGSKRVKLFIWDTAGSERFRTVTSSYYRGSHGVIFVYDCNRRETFERLRFWIQELRDHAGRSEPVKLLVANKIDVGQSQVSRSEAERLARENSMMFIETSAKVGLGIQQAFEEVVLKILDTPALLENAGGIHGSVLHSTNSSQAGQEAFDPPGCWC